MSEFRLADRLATMSESATLALNAKAKQLAAQGKTVYNLTAGELDSGTPEYIQAYVAGKLDANKYSPVAGLPDLRQHIAHYAKRYYGLDWIRADNVIVTAGAKPALYASLLSIVNPGDEVIVPSPAWVSYHKLIDLVGGVAVDVPLTENFDLDAEAIAGKITPRTKAIIVNSPHNPTGAIFSKSTVEQLARAVAGQGIAIISDDIYARLTFDDGFVPVPRAGFENLIIINGFSKSQALTGWRIGYAIASDDVIKAMTGLLSHINGNAGLPGQYAAIAALERGDNPPDGVLDGLRSKLQLVERGLEKVSGIKYHRPGGAFYVYLDVRQITHDSSKWCEELLDQTGVALVPGEAFGTPGFCRLTFATDAQTLKDALEAIRKFV